MIHYSPLPYYPLSAAQLAITNVFKKSQEFYLYMSRQTGKSNVASYMFVDRVIAESKEGFDYLVMGPIEKTINELFIGNVFIEFAGGKEVVPDQDVNSIWIPTPEKYKQKFREQKEQLVKLVESGQAYITDLCQYEQWVADGLLSENLEWVKFFHEDLKPGGRGKGEDYQGKIFTGARITFASSNNPNLSAIVRGRQFNGVWIDEIGETKNDIRSMFVAGLNTKSGWLLCTGTPPESPKNPWVYNTVISPIINNPNIIKKRSMGVDFYNFSRSDFDPDTGEEFKFNSYLAIGKLENVWQYVYEGKKRLRDANRTRPVPYSPVYLLDDNGEKIPEESGTYVFKGEKYVVGHQYEMVASTSQSITTGDEEAYQREYQVAFNSVSDRVFDSFGLNNVIARKDFNPNNYSVHLLGFDYGSKDRSGDTILKNRSSTAWCKVAVIPIGDAFQYVVYDAQYINKPNEVEIANCWDKSLNDGLPVIADNALWNQLVLAGSNSYSTFINALPQLKNNRLSRTNEGIFKCFKWNSNAKKAEKFNEYFSMTHITKERPYYNISKPTELGRKIMITDNCIELINFLISYGYKVKKIIGTDMSEQSLTEVGDDLYDAMTYAIDFIEKHQRGDPKYKNRGWLEALKFKRKYDQWKGSIQENSELNSQNSILSMLGSRFRF